MKRKAKTVVVGDASPRAAVGGARYEVAAGAGMRVAEEAAVWKAPGARVISATEAARNFSDLISRVAYKGETYVVERGGKPMCSLVPVEARRCTGGELLALLSGLPRPAEEFLAAVEAVTLHQATIEPSAWEK